MLIIFALVVFVYFGGKYVPTELKRYKELILGIAIGCLICCATGMNMEGLDEDDMDKGKGGKGMESMDKGKGMDGMGWWLLFQATPADKIQAFVSIFDKEQS